MFIIIRHRLWGVSAECECEVKRQRNFIYALYFIWRRMNNNYRCSWCLFDYRRVYLYLTARVWKRSETSNACTFVAIQPVSLHGASKHWLRKACQETVRGERVMVRSRSGSGVTVPSSPRSSWTLWRSCSCRTSIQTYTLASSSPRVLTWGRRGSR